MVIFSCLRGFVDGFGMFCASVALDGFELFLSTFEWLALVAFSVCEWRLVA